MRSETPHSCGVLDWRGLHSGERRSAALACTLRSTRSPYCSRVLEAFGECSLARARNHAKPAHYSGGARTNRSSAPWEPRCCPPGGSDYNTKWGGRSDFYFHKPKIRVFHRFLARTFPRAPGAPGALERLNSPLPNSPIWLIFLHCQAGRVAGTAGDFGSITPGGSNKQAFPRQQIKQRERSALKENTRSDGKARKKMERPIGIEPTPEPWQVCRERSVNNLRGTFRSAE